MLRRWFLGVLLLALVFTCHCAAEAGLLTVHFLDVGEGDAAIIQCDGQTLMIDGGNRDSCDFVYTYLKKLGVSRIDYMISTHPHDDHAYGLATALAVCEVGTVYSPVTGFDGKGFTSFLEKMREKGVAITVPHRGDSFSLGGASVTFLSEPQNWWSLNDQSLVVRLVYGDYAFLFTGDAEWTAEQDLLSSGMDLRADVLKVGHHGASQSTSPEFVKAVNPSFAVISVGAHNSFGHPAAETLMALQRPMVNIFRTDIHGSIICYSDGQSIAFRLTKPKTATASPTPEPTPDATDAPDPAGTPGPEKEVQFVGNRNTHVFHLPDCQSVRDMKAKNRVDLFSREEAINLGFTPCGRCRP